MRLTAVLPAALLLAAAGPALSDGSPIQSQSQTLPSGIIVSAGVGYSHIEFGETRFVAITDGVLSETLGSTVNHDGEVDGAKTVFEIDGLRRGRLFGHSSRFAINGFYAHYDTDEDSACVNTGNGTITDCVIFALYDQSPAFEDFTGGVASDWRVQTKLDVDHWGVGLELKLGRNDIVSAGLKDSIPVEVASPLVWRLGAAVKRFDTDKEINAIDLGPGADPVHLKEDLNTTYYGLYAGFDYTHVMRSGLTLLIKGEGGAYYADTDYTGHYHSTDTFSGPGRPLTQVLELNDNSAAFIGKIGVELNKQIRFGSIGLFGEAEWYSDVPNVLYNNVEHAPAPLTGTNDGTRLGEDSAFVYTVGGRLNVPLGGRK
jgi:hypothetical protein